MPKTKRVRELTASSATQRLLDVPIADLIPTPDNPRMIRDDAEMHALVASVVSLGVLQPVLARPHPQQSGKYDLRSGHRRWVAAKRAGFTTLPCFVREMTDAVAMEITVTENLQRENLHPLEEGRGVHTLLERGWEVQTIADRLGRSPNWVARRAKLCDLTETWRREVLDEKSVMSRWPATLLEVVARVPAEIQDAAHEVCRQRRARFLASSDVPSAATLHQWLAREYLHTLSGAPWKLSDETLLPEAGSCMSCPKRASCQPLLFDDEVQPGKRAAADKCLDPTCYARKQVAFVERKQTELLTKHDHVVAIVGETESQIERQRAMRRGAVEEWTVCRAKRTDKGAIPALVTCGSEAGTVFWVQDPKARVGRQRASGAAKPASLADRRKVLESRRQAYVVSKIRGALRQMAIGTRNFEVHRLYGHLSMEQQLILLTLCFGTDRRWSLLMNKAERCRGMVMGGGWKGTDAVASNSQKALVGNLYRQIFPVMAARLDYRGLDTVGRHHVEALRVCALIGLDSQALYQEATAKIPEPKSWAALQTRATQSQTTGGKSSVVSGKARPAGGAVKTGGTKAKPPAGKSRTRSGKSARTVGNGRRA